MPTQRGAAAEENKVLAEPPSLRQITDDASMWGPDLFGSGLLFCGPRLRISRATIPCRLVSNAVEWLSSVPLGDVWLRRDSESAMREGGMRNLKRFFAAIAVGFFFVGMAAADTLELRSGKVVQGRYLGGTAAVLRFEVNGEIQTFSTNDVVALTFTGRSGGAAPMAAPAPAPAAPPRAAAPAAAPAPGGRDHLAGPDPGQGNRRPGRAVGPPRPAARRR